MSSVATSQERTAHFYHCNRRQSSSNGRSCNLSRSEEQTITYRPSCLNSRILLMLSLRYVCYQHGEEINTKVQTTSETVRRQKTTRNTQLKA